MLKREKGFSLIELLIVVAIILIIAVISIPNLLRSRLSANEASAVDSLRTMTTAAVTYSFTYGDGFPPNLAAMGTATPPGPAATCDEAQLIDNVLTLGTKSGYAFTYEMANPNAIKSPGCSNPGGNSYFIEAHPQSVGQTGQRSFCSDQAGVIRYDSTGTTVANDAKCQGLPALQ